MKITDRFIVVPAEVYSTEADSMGIDSDPVIKDVYLCPAQIESFGEQDECVCVSLKSGGYVYVVMKLDDFIKAIEEFYS